jgi:hypothetical protein
MNRLITSFCQNLAISLWSFKMNLYLLSQDVNNNYDTYDSMVVCAENEHEAKRMHPGGGVDEWIDQYATWASAPDQVSVKYLGVADASIERGKIITSFNAG